MARVGRLAGALLAETEGRYYLVGDLKEPCDFTRAGFESPGEIDARLQPYRVLTAVGPVSLGSPVLSLAIEGEELARRLAAFLVIERNGSVSERLWRLIVQPETHQGAAEVDARWLGEIPPEIWRIVRDAVLRCT
jgi:hypothetical protein